MQHVPTAESHNSADAGPSTGTDDAGSGCALHLVDCVVASKPATWPEECPICYDMPAFYTTPCGHAFCLACLRRLGTGSDRRACPLCRTPILFEDCGPMPDAANDGRPSTRSILQHIKTRPSDIASTLIQDADLLHRVLDAHPAKDWFLDVVESIPPNHLPSIYRVSLMMSRMAIEVVPAALAKHKIDGASLPAAPDKCRLALKASPRWSGYDDTVVRAVATRLGIYAAMRAVHGRTVGLPLPAPVAISALHPVQSTVTLVDGTVMNLLQYAVFDLVTAYGPDALRLWVRKPPRLALCPNLVRDVAADPHPTRNVQRVIVAALLSVHRGLSVHRPPTTKRWDHLFDCLCAAPPRGGTNTTTPVQAEMERILDDMITQDTLEESYVRCAATCSRERRAVADPGDETSFGVIALCTALPKVVRSIRPTALRSCLSDDGWMSLWEIVHAVGDDISPVVVAHVLDHLADCKMLIKECMRPAMWNHARYRYAPH
nr:ring-finger domain [Pandoravirus massiliensis]